MWEMPFAPDTWVPRSPTDWRSETRQWEYISKPSQIYSALLCLAPRDAKVLSMSERERADRLTGERPITVEDIRALAGPSTPHFSLQVRNRIAQIIADLPEGDPVRVEGEKQIERLTQLAEFTGDPRSGTGAGH